MYKADVLSIECQINADCVRAFMKSALGFNDEYLLNSKVNPGLTSHLRKFICEEETTRVLSFTIIEECVKYSRD